jgi:hypothetical protein
MADATSSLQLLLVAIIALLCYISSGIGINGTNKPHPRKELLEYQVRQLVEQLEQEGLI